MYVYMCVCVCVCVCVYVCVCVCVCVYIHIRIFSDLNSWAQDRRIFSFNSLSELELVTNRFWITTIIAK